MSGDWTKPPEFSAEERKELELEKLILAGNGRDSAIKLVLVTLSLAHRERVELPVMFDLIEKRLTFVRHASELELLKFCVKALDAHEIKPEEMRSFLALFARKVHEQTLSAALDAQKLAQIIQHAKEERSDASQ